MPFLKLPTELRLQIYKIVAVPHDAPFSAYAGLYLSCRQIKTELDKEAPTAINKHLATVSKFAPSVQIKTLQPFPSLHLQLFLERYNFVDDLDAKHKEFMERILALHIPQITIGFEQVNTKLKVAGVERPYLLNLFSSFQSPIHVSRFKLDMGCERECLSDVTGIVCERCIPQCGPWRRQWRKEPVDDLVSRVFVTGQALSAAERSQWTPAQQMEEEAEIQKRDFRKMCW
jgi:hypothetical protein